MRTLKKFIHSISADTGLYNSSRLFRIFFRKHSQTNVILFLYIMKIEKLLSHDHTDPVSMLR